MLFVGGGRKSEWARKTQNCSLEHKCGVCRSAFSYLWIFCWVPAHVSCVFTSVSVVWVYLYTSIYCFGWSLPIFSEIIYARTIDVIALSAFVLFLVCFGAVIILLKCKKHGRPTAVGPTFTPSITKRSGKFAFHIYISIKETTYCSVTWDRRCLHKLIIMDCCL